MNNRLNNETPTSTKSEAVDKSTKIIMDAIYECGREYIKTHPKVPKGKDEVTAAVAWIVGDCYDRVAPIMDTMGEPRDGMKHTLTAFHAARTVLKELEQGQIMAALTNMLSKLLGGKTDADTPRDPYDFGTDLE